MQFMASNNTNDLKINHMPFGFNDIYYMENICRQPSYPLEGESVLIKVEITPVIVNIYLLVIVNGIMNEKTEMKPLTCNEKEVIYQSVIGSFAFGDYVEYYFVVDLPDRQAVSKVYSFSVRKWFDIRNFNVKDSHSEDVNNGIGGSGQNILPAFSVTSQSDNTLKCTIYIKGALEDNNGNSCNNKDFVLNNGYHIETDQSNGIRILDRENVRIIDLGSTNAGLFKVLTDSEGGIYKIRINLPLAAEERIYGTGERYSDIQFRGMVIDNYVYDKFANQKLITYLPVPFFISSQGYGIFIDSSSYSVFDFGYKNPDRIEIEVNLSLEQKLEFYIFTGKPKSIIQAFTDYIGKPKLPPKWAFGLWMSSNNWDSECEVLNQVELSQRYKIPATVIVLEQWSDEETFYIFNDAKYMPGDVNDDFSFTDLYYHKDGKWPNPKAMVDYLHQLGIKVLLWQIPVIKNIGKAENTRQYFDELKVIENDFCLRNKDGSLYRIPPNQWFAGSLVIDFTNPEAKKWWFDKRNYLIDEIGIDGFKTDGGECIFGDDVVFSNGCFGDTMKNLYPIVYIESYHDYIAKRKKGEGILFSRAGFSGIQKYTLQWAGDEKSTFEAFKSSLRAGLNCGVSGIAFWGWDLAGFSGDIPTTELYLRAAAMSVFCPIMQYHTEPSDKSDDRTPWNIAQRTGNPSVITSFEKLTNLRMNILPYIYYQSKISSKSGIPLMRSMYIEFHEDPLCFNIWDQYMFGDSMLIAPIVEEGTSFRKVYLPEGNWKDFFKGHTYKGKSFIDVKAEPGEIPVFIRQNSIIPLNLSEEFCLGSYVGNNVDVYANLSFMIHIHDNIFYSFDDDQNNEIIFNIIRKQDKVDIKCTTNKSITIGTLIDNYTFKLQLDIGETTSSFSLKELNEENEECPHTL